MASGERIEALISSAAPGTCRAGERHDYSMLSRKLVVSFEHVPSMLLKQA